MNVTLKQALIAVVNEDIPSFTTTCGQVTFTFKTRKPTIDDKIECRKFIVMEWLGNKSRYNPTGLMIQEFPIFESFEDEWSSLYFDIRHLVRRVLGLKLPPIEIY